MSVPENVQVNSSQESPFLLAFPLWGIWNRLASSVSFGRRFFRGERASTAASAYFWGFSSRIHTRYNPSPKWTVGGNLQELQPKLRKLLLDETWPDLMFGAMVVFVTFGFDLPVHASVKK
jgi:hypothetical protein